MDYLDNLLKFVDDKNDLLNALNGLHPHISETLYKPSCNYIFNDDELNPSYSISIEYTVNYIHEHLHTGDWCNVPDYKRKAYTAASFVKACVILKEDKNAIRNSLKCVDLGFMLGLPLRLNADLLTKSASYLNGLLGTDTINEEKSPKKMKLDDIVGKSIDFKWKVNLEDFYKSYFLSETPLIIQGHMSHWPALEKWKDVNYLIKIAGQRTVPVEIGSSYSDVNFSQKLMTLREFIDMYYFKKTEDVGYLAQHDLLNQVPELKEDIKIPDYCCTSRNFDDDNLFEPEINAWFGPEGTVSSLHHDPKDNLLCQVFGKKQVILFSPSDSEYLYAHDALFLNNTAQVDPVKPDFELFPDFKKATMYKCYLNSGEMLYIPPKWWHHVTALEKSFSVNFWWQ